MIKESSRFCEHRPPPGFGFIETDCLIVARHKRRRSPVSLTGSGTAEDGATPAPARSSLTHRHGSCTLPRRRVFSDLALTNDLLGLASSPLHKHLMYKLPLRSRTCAGLTFGLSEGKRLDAVAASVPQRNTEKMRTTGPAGQPRWGVM